MINTKELASFIETTASVESTSKVLSVIIFVGNYFLKWYLNSILSFIRTLSMILHMLAVDINYPGNTDIVFSALIEICTFDYFETE